jgi:hypothetical protein
MPIPAEIVRYFKVGSRDLVYLKFILEAYEGMSTLSTVEPKEGIVRLSIPCGFTEDMQSIINTVGSGITIEEVIFTPKDPVNA